MRVIVPVVYMMLLFLPGSVLSSPQIEYLLLAAIEDVDRIMPMPDVAKSDLSVSWINKAEVRYKHNNENEQAYALRVQPKPGELYTAERTLYELYNEQNTVEYRSLLNDTLKEKYLVFIDVLQQQYDANYAVEYLALTKNKLALIQQLVQTSEFNPAELLQTKLDVNHQDAQITIYVNQFKAMVSQHRWGDSSDTQFSLSSDIEWLLPIEEIKNSLNEYEDRLHLLNNNLQVKRRLLDLSIAKQDLLHDRAKNKSGISFVELEYLDKNNNGGSITVGYSLPFGGDSVSKQRREKDVLYRQTVLHNSERKAMQIRATVVITLTSLFDQYSIVQLNLGDIEKQTFSLSESTTPKMLLDLKQAQLKQQKKLQDIYILVMRHYIEYLYTAGQLIAQPFRNVLHRNLPSLIGE